MEIDVIIPLYKPGKELFTLLDKLGSQSVPVHQVILLNTEEKYFEQLIYGIRFLETYQNVKVYHVSKREFDHGGTRRMGVKKSSADVFVMMTQDAMPADETLIEELVKPFDDPEVWAAYARQLPNEDCREVEKYTRRGKWRWPMRDSCPERIRHRWRAIPENLTIRQSPGSNRQQTWTAWGSRPFSAPMSVQPIAGRSMRNWAGSSDIRYLMKI